MGIGLGINEEGWYRLRYELVSDGKSGQVRRNTVVGIEELIKSLPRDL